MKAGSLGRLTGYTSRVPQRQRFPVTKLRSSPELEAVAQPASSYGQRPPRYAADDAFGKYVIQRFIGRGGMAEVYEAIHSGLRKRVALKVLSATTASDKALRERFLREGERAARIRHPNVVDITDIGTVNNTPYLVMELLHGETLESYLIREAPLEVEHAVGLLLPVLAATAAGHAQSVVHRDLKPENIFLALDAGHRTLPKVLDFGVSRLMDEDDERLTIPNAVLGTPHYMSPEQARGEDAGAPSDQYTLALVLYEAVTGQSPRNAESLLKLLNQASSGVIAPPRGHRPNLAVEFEEVLLKALSQATEDRYATLADFALALLPFATPAARRYWREELVGQAGGEAAAQSNSAPQVRISMGGEQSSRPGRTTLAGPGPGSAASARAVVGLGPQPDGPTDRQLDNALLGVTVELPHASDDESANDEDEDAPDLGEADTVAPPPLDDKPARHRTLPAAGQSLTAPPRQPSPRPSWGALLAVAVVLAAGLLLWRATTQSTPIDNPQPIPAAPAEITVRIDAEPTDALIQLDGVKVGRGSFVTTLPKDGALHTVRLSSEGYETREISFRDAPPPVRIKLAPASDASPTAQPMATATAAPNAEPEPAATLPPTSAPTRTTTAAPANTAPPANTAAPIDTAAPSDTAAPANAAPPSTSQPPSTPSKNDNKDPWR